MDKAVRITKAQRYADIKALLKGEAVKFGTTPTDALDFIDHEVALLTKKNASVDKRKAAEAVKNDGYKALIVDFLAALDPSVDGMTCTDIGKSIPALAAFNTSKMSSLCNGLVKDGSVVKATVKGKTLFKLA